MAGVYQNILREDEAFREACFLIYSDDTTNGVDVNYYIWSRLHFYFDVILINPTQMWLVTGGRHTLCTFTELVPEGVIRFCSNYGPCTDVTVCLKDE